MQHLLRAYANGITSTGVTATTNHTIAVDPSQIPYGSKVVINGQVYVAEDCGGAIKTNCIDIYVATHAEGEGKGRLLHRRLSHSVNKYSGTKRSPAEPIYGILPEIFL